MVDASPFHDQVATRNLILRDAAARSDPAEGSGAVASFLVSDGRARARVPHGERSADGGERARGDERGGGGGGDEEHR